MRKARQKIKGEGCYYHLMSRVSGCPGEFPFGDVEKEHAFKVLEDLEKLYFLEVISFCCMGNHWHLVVYDSNRRPDGDEVLQRYNRYLKRHKKIPLQVLGEDQLEQLSSRLTDISYFMKDLKQNFTTWFNRRHNRRGTLWADRFKSTILEGEQALWNCVKYVELNPVRAGLVEHPEDYRFCSWGRFKGSGKHPFMANFIKHMKRNSFDLSESASKDDILAEFAKELVRIIKNESGATEEIVREEMAKAKRKESMPMLFLRRSRYWTDGAIIGSKDFVQRVAMHFDDKKRVMRKRMGRGLDDTSGEYLHSYKLVGN
jgi:putative transposase